MAQNQATYLRGLEVFESTCCTVEVSAWCLLADGLACTELVLLTLGDADDGCSEDSDTTLLRPSADWVVSLPCVSRRGSRVRLRRWDNVVEESSATGSHGVADATGTHSATGVSEERSLAVLLQQPMGMASEHSRNRT